MTNSRLESLTTISSQIILSLVCSKESHQQRQVIMLKREFSNMKRGNERTSTPGFRAWLKNVLTLLILPSTNSALLHCRENTTEVILASAYTAPLFETRKL